MAFWQHSRLWVVLMTGACILAGCAPQVLSTPEPEGAVEQVTVTIEEAPTFTPELASRLTEEVGAIVADPAVYEGQEVVIVGLFRGWDLFGEVGQGPPMTRSDWVIKDASGAIYVAAEKGLAPPFDPGSELETEHVVEVVGIVRISPRGQPYIEPEKVDVVE